MLNIFPQQRDAGAEELKKNGSTCVLARIDIVARRKNALIELSGSGIERVGILEKAIKDIGADRVLYGSDFTINDPAAVIARVRNAVLTAEDREKILFRNVERPLANAGARKA
ncbi:MAG: amidohydrolase family protein [Acidobacteriota bacterium]